MVWKSLRVKNRENSNGCNFLNIWPFSDFKKEMKSSYDGGELIFELILTKMGSDVTVMS